MKITEEQFQQFCRSIKRGNTHHSRPVVVQALEGIGVTVDATQVSKALDRARDLINSGRARELKAALHLLGRDRVSLLTEQEATRLLEFFSDPLDEF